jgi:hypothetical protein
VQMINKTTLIDLLLVCSLNLAHHSFQLSLPKIMFFVPELCLTLSGICDDMLFRL